MTALIGEGKHSPWGNVVASGVLVQNHQHLFCLRINLMIDGMRNALVQKDSVVLPDTDKENPFGNAWNFEGGE